MRFLIPAQTLAEHKHRQMPVFETLGLTATQGLVIGGLGAAAGGLGSLGLGIFNASKKAPSYQPPSLMQQAAQQQMLVQNAANEAMQYAPQFTQANIDLQNQVTPGSSAQREKALNQLNAYIQGQVPTDVQQNIQRQVAQNLGGGFNLFTGGGQAPQNFARNLGQTSLGLSQYGLSAAPTWQQLANSMVASPTQIFGSALQAGEFATGSQLSQAENRYQSAMNQYGAGQAGVQGIASGLSGLGSAATSFGNSVAMANYLSPSALGAQNTLAQAGFAGGQIPSYLDATSNAAAYNAGQAPQALTALPAIQY